MSVVRLNNIARQLLAFIERHQDFSVPGPLNGAVLVKNGQVIARQTGLAQQALESWLWKHASLADMVVSLQPVNSPIFALSMTGDLADIAVSAHDHLLLRRSLNILLHFEILHRQRQRPWVAELVLQRDVLPVITEDVDSLWLLGQVLRQYGMICGAADVLGNFSWLNSVEYFNSRTVPLDRAAKHQSSKLMLVRLHDECLEHAFPASWQIDERLVLTNGVRSLGGQGVGQLALSKEQLVKTVKPAVCHLFVQNQVQ